MIFVDFIQHWFLWIKVGHLAAVIAWMAGMLYLPRLFVYHVSAPIGSDNSETFKVMERRLLKIILNPAMAATWFFGILLIFSPGAVDWGEGWPWGKAILVILLSAVHGFLSRCQRNFAIDQNQFSAKFFRIINELPTIMLVGILVFVIVKPF